MELDEDFEVTDVAWGWDEKAADRIACAVPTPFQPGDIVIDRTSRTPHPFVFRATFPRDEDGSRCSPYGCKKSRTLLDELFHDPECPHRPIMASEHTMWRNRDWRMVVYGYKIENGADNIEFKDYGACENYLNLEYHRGSLDGNLRQLAIVSETIKGSLSCAEAANFNQLVAMNNQLRAMRR